VFGCKKKKTGFLSDGFNVVWQEKGLQNVK